MGRRRVANVAATTVALVWFLPWLHDARHDLIEMSGQAKPKVPRSGSSVVDVFGDAWVWNHGSDS